MATFRISTFPSFARYFTSGQLKWCGYLQFLQFYWFAFRPCNALHWSSISIHALTVTPNLFNTAQHNHVAIVVF
jgi:hypothetical protein